MPEQDERAIPVTIYLTPGQIREAYRELVESEVQEDWIDDPAVLQMLAKRERKVAKEVREGRFVTLPELQDKLGK